MTDCVICRRPDAGTAYACTTCAARARTNLGTIANLAGDAQDAADGFARYALPGAGGGDSRTPSDLTASAAFARAAAIVIGCAQDVAETRGREMPTPDRRPIVGPACREGWCQHPSCRAIRTRTHEHPVTAAATWLVDQLGWLRHRAQVDETFADLGQAARDIARIADRPPELVIVGACECGSWVYGHNGASTARCRGCGASYDVEKSRDVLRHHMDDKMLAPAQIATLAARAGHNRQKVRNLVNVWVRRGVLRPTLIPLPPGVQGPMDIVRDTEGRPAYRLGDVLERLARLTTTPAREAG